MDYDLYLELAKDLPALEQRRHHIGNVRGTAQARRDRTTVDDLGPIVRGLDRVIAAPRATLARRYPGRLA